MLPARSCTSKNQPVRTRCSNPPGTGQNNYYMEDFSNNSPYATPESCCVRNPHRGDPEVPVPPPRPRQCSRTSLSVTGRGPRGRFLRNADGKPREGQGRYREGYGAVFGLPDCCREGDPLSAGVVVQDNVLRAQMKVRVLSDGSESSRTIQKIKNSGKRIRKFFTKKFSSRKKFQQIAPARPPFSQGLKIPSFPVETAT